MYLFALGRGGFVSPALGKLNVKRQTPVPALFICSLLTAGFVAAWLSAMLSVTWMVGWLQHRRLAVFGWWRLAAAAVVLALVLTQRL